MVIANAMCALNLVSGAMLNGVCCVYQMQEEEERQKAHREAIRRSIRSEYERNRRMDMEQRLREKEMAHFTEQLREERRRNLMATKTSAASSSCQERCPAPKQRSLSDENPVASLTASRRFEFAESESNSLVKKSRALRSRRSRSYHHPPPIVLSNSCTYSDTPEMKISSLLDSEDEEDEEDAEEFVDIPIE